MKILWIFDHPIFNIGLIKIFDYPLLDFANILILKIYYYPFCKVGIIFILVPLINIYRKDSLAIIQL